MNLQPYKIPILKTFKNGKTKLIGVKKIKWFTSPHVTVNVVKQGDYQDIEYTIFNPGSRSHIEKWLAEDLGFEFPYYTTKGRVKVDPESLDSMEHPSGKLLRRYLKLTKDQSQLGGAEGSLIKNYDAITQTVKSRVDTNGTLCLTDDVIFETDFGPRPLYTLKVGMQVLTSKGTYKTITDIFENGIKPITKVSTAKGLTLTTTPNHPYLVQDKWVNAEDLVISDTLTTVHSIEECHLEPPKVTFTTDTVSKIETLPERMTYGVTVEDIHTHVTNGIVTHNTGRFTSSAINLAQIPAQKEFRELFRAPVFYDIPDELYAKVCNEIDCKDSYE